MAEQPALHAVRELIDAKRVEGWRGERLAIEPARYGRLVVELDAVCTRVNDFGGLKLCEVDGVEIVPDLGQLRADLAAIYSHTRPLPTEGNTAELVDGVVEIRDADGNLLAVASEEAFEAVCARATEAARS